MRRFSVLLVLVFGVLAMVGCEETKATVKPKRDPRYVDYKQYLGVYEGTPTAENPSKEKVYLELRPSAIYYFDHDGMAVLGTYAYLGGELELGVREIDGLTVIQIRRMLKEGIDASIKANKERGRKPDTKEDFAKYEKEAFKIFYRFTLQPDGFTMKTSERGPGLYVFKRAPEGTEVPSRAKKKAELGGREEERPMRGAMSMGGGQPGAQSSAGSGGESGN